MMKLKKISADDRYEDIHDAVTILKVLTDKAGGAIDRGVVARWNLDRDDPIKDEAFLKVNNIYGFSFRTRGFL
jgi:hypothetical protein